MAKKDLDFTVYRFDMVFRGLFAEMAKFGKIIDMVMCDNLFGPLRGSLFVVYSDIKSGEKCRKLMNNRLYDGKVVKPIIIAQESLDNLLCQPFLKGNCKSNHSSHPDSNCEQVHQKYVTGFIKRFLMEYLTLTQKC